MPPGLNFSKASSQFPLNFPKATLPKSTKPFLQLSAAFPPCSSYLLPHLLTSFSSPPPPLSPQILQAAVDLNKELATAGLSQSDMQAVAQQYMSAVNQGKDFTLGGLGAGTGAEATSHAGEGHVGAG